MEEIFIYTDEEKEESELILGELKETLGQSFLENDLPKLREHLHGSIADNTIRRNVFGLNPILCALQTAAIAVKDIGLKRDSVIAILLHQSVQRGTLSLEEIENRFGDGVSRIIHGLIRIQTLYQKTPVIESENFRNLLLSFAEDMRVILIMIADRVNLMRQIRDVENKEAQRKVSEEASYLYAPLAHKLGLYQLKS
ncbi:HD domain-containing protein, partial [Prevotella denticola]